MFGRGRRGEDDTQADQGTTWTTLPADGEELRQRLVAMGLSDQADALVALVRPSVRLRPQGRPGDGEAALTRLGGRPVLAASAPWPRGDGGPLSLLQVDLVDLPRDAASDLPDTGVVGFFYDATAQDDWGDQPEDQRAWAVTWTAPGDVGEPRPFPDDLAAGSRFPPWPLVPSVETTFAPWESWDVDLAGVPDDVDGYVEALGDPDDGEDEPVHRMLGHPDPVQGDMQQVCQLASNGIPWTGRRRAGARSRVGCQLDRGSGGCSRRSTALRRSG